MLECARLRVCPVYNEISLPQGRYPLCGLDFSANSTGPSMSQKPRKILAVVEDLFFIVKINDAAKRSGLSCEFVKSAQEALDRARQEPPLLIIIDLNARSLKPVELIAKLRTEELLKKVSIIAFVSHLEAELKNRAQSAGASMVLARSAFSMNLPQILKRHSGSL
jgi:CheY-like chemotaxis protein